MDQFALYSHFRAFYKQFLCQAGQLAPGHYLMPLGVGYPLAIGIL